MNHFQIFRRALCRFALVLMLTHLAAASSNSEAAEPNGGIAVSKPQDASGSNDALRSYLQLQEQLHATQLALERNRKEAEDLAARNAEAMATRLEGIQKAINSQRERELEAMLSANRLLVIVAGSFAGVGFIAMLLTAYLQWRAVNRLAEFASMLSVQGRLALPATSNVEAQLAGGGAAEQSSTRLFGALSKLERRILELEQTTIAHARAVSAGESQPVGQPANGDTVSPEADNRVSVLMAKGQSLLNLEQAEDALACFDEVLSLEPNHPEALVKKGVALEQQRRVDDALRCYDRAIAADGALTIAYLQKGGLFNRLERYEEALQCYEQALRTQEKNQGV